MKKVWRCVSHTEPVLEGKKLCEKGESLGAECRIVLCDPAPPRPPATRKLVLPDGKVIKYWYCTKCGKENPDHFDMNHCYCVTHERWNQWYNKNKWDPAKEYWPG